MTWNIGDPVFISRSFDGYPLVYRTKPERIEALEYARAPESSPVPEPIGWTNRYEDGWGKVFPTKVAAEVWGQANNYRLEEAGVPLFVAPPDMAAQLAEAHRVRDEAVERADSIDAEAARWRSRYEQERSKNESLSASIMSAASTAATGEPVAYRYRDHVSDPWRTTFSLPSRKWNFVEPLFAHAPAPAERVKIRYGARLVRDWNGGYVASVTWTDKQSEATRFYSSRMFRLTRPAKKAKQQPRMVTMMTCSTCGESVQASRHVCPKRRAALAETKE